MKIKLVTLYDEKLKSIGDLSSRVMAEYCARRGYEFVCYKHLPDKSRGAVWNKIRAIQQELPSCDWLLWMDADSIPITHGFSLEKLIEKAPDKDLMFSSDGKGPCAGILLSRNCAWSVQFFQTAWFCGQMASGVHFEQDTMLALSGTFPSINDRMLVLPESFVCNRCSEFLPDCFAMHYYSSNFSSNKKYLASIARRMGIFISSGWSPSAHLDLKIITGDDAFGRLQNESAGYEVYEMGVESNLPQLIRKALELQHQFIVYMDANAFAIRRFDEVNTLDYDVGMTMRRKEERGATNRPMMNGFLDAGVLFFNYTPAAFKFLEIWESELALTPSDQEALNAVVLRATDLTEYDKVFPLEGIRIKIFKCEEYNFSRWPQEPLPETRIVQCNRIEALEDWGNRKWQDK
jgi:hypothetical protein